MKSTTDESAMPGVSVPGFAVLVLISKNPPFPGPYAANSASVREFIQLPGTFSIGNGAAEKLHVR